MDVKRSLGASATSSSSARKERSSWENPSKSQRPEHQPHQTCEIDRKPHLFSQKQHIRTTRTTLTTSPPSCHPCRSLASQSTTMDSERLVENELMNTPIVRPTSPLLPKSCSSSVPQNQLDKKIQLKNRENLAFPFLYRLFPDVPSCLDKFQNASRGRRLGSQQK
jgi:hypothetical protein